MEVVVPTELANEPQSNAPLAQHPKKSSWPLWRVCLFWLGPVMGLCALVWFLIRVLPKPNRAEYPCQRAAFPIATGFILWLTGFLGATVAWKKARQLFAAAKYTPAIACAILGAFFAIQWWDSTPENPARADDTVYSIPETMPNHPVGVAKGVLPGRVTSVRNTDATTWDGQTANSPIGSPSYYKGWWGRSTDNNGMNYYDPADPTNTTPASFTNQTVVEHMVAQNLQWLTGTTGTTTDQYDTKAAWTVIFGYFNSTHSAPATGTKNAYNYYSPNKFFLKVNFVNGNSTSWGASTRQYLFTSPEVVVSLLKSLNAVGVDPTNVYICDPDRAVPAFFSNRVNKLLDVAGLGHPQYYGTSDLNYGSGAGTPAVYFSKGYSNNSASATYSYTVDYVPNKINESTYMINLGVMKTHARAGVSLCGKTYVGILGRDPKGSGTQYDIHAGLLSNNSLNKIVGADDYGQYRDQADLSGHPQFGGKCLLWIIDALYTGYDWSSVSPPRVWYSLPQKAGASWYPSTILMSLDPVAIDSVGIDMWKAEYYAAEAAATAASNKNLRLPGIYSGTTNTKVTYPCDPTRKGIEDYLIEMATAGLYTNTSGDHTSRGGLVYRPAGADKPISSLGAFEVWSGASSRQYSRNRGTGLGIELVNVPLDTQPGILGSYVFYNNSAWDGSDPAANANDDNAIAPDKIALRSGGTASFLNYTSYSKGINGIMVDIPAGLTPAASDFEFRVGNDNNPAAWSLADSPTMTVRTNVGINNATRITFTWTTGIKGKWLRVRLISGNSMNMPEDIFYFGNAPGDTGNSATQVRVDAIDELVVRADPHTYGSEATIDNPHDFNRDKYVDTSDEFVARSNVTYFETDLQLITVP
jgi:hypothetical protein